MSEHPLYRCAQCRRAVPLDPPSVLRHPGPEPAVGWCRWCLAPLEPPPNTPSARGAAARWLGFPERSSLGDLFVLPASRSPETTWSPYAWRSFGEARGEIRIPAGYLCCLRVRRGGVRSLARFLRYEAPDLDAVHLSHTELDDRELARLAPLRGLVALYLSATQVTARGLSALGAHPELRVLWLGKLRPGAEGLARLAALPHLAALSLGGTRVTDGDLAALAAVPSLRALDLYETRVHGPGLRSLRSCRALRSLRLVHTRLRADALASLAENRSLRSLELPVGVRGQVAELRPLDRLSRLSFEGRGGRAGADDVTLAHLPPLPALRALDLAFGPVTDAGLPPIRRLGGLRMLRLSGTRVTAGGIASLRGHRALVELRLDRTDVGDEVLEPLETLPSLRWLVLDELSAGGVRRLAAAAARGAFSRLSHLGLVSSLALDLRAELSAALPNLTVACPGRPLG